MAKGNILDLMAKEYEPATSKGKRTCGTLTENTQSTRDTRPKKIETQAPMLNWGTGTRHQMFVQPTQSLQNGTTTWQNGENTGNINPQQNGQIPPGDVVTIMHRQNEITTALLQQQRLLSLPAWDIPVYEGDPLQYKAFIKAFERGVEDKASRADCLYYLEQFTAGQPKELVRSCQHMAPERAYVVAKGLLREHFGSEYKITRAYIEKALAWPIKKFEDIKALQAYTMFLRGCCNVMEELDYMQELDMPINMKTLASKLPFKLRERWRSKAYDILEATDDRAHFGDVVTFLEKQV